jgi:hypothetical protein
MRIKGYEKYDIDSNGIVTSYRGKKSHPMKYCLDKQGYYYVTLYKNEWPHCNHHKTIHRLLAQHFIPNPNNLPCVLHRNDNPLDNRLCNLYWGTRKDNRIDADRNNKTQTPKGKRYLRPLDHINIKYLYSSGMTRFQIAELYNVNVSTVHYSLHVYCPRLGV